MVRFIRLTDVDDKPLLVNLDQVRCIVAVADKGTKVSFGKQAAWVQEPIEVIQNYIEDVDARTKK